MSSADQPHIPQREGKPQAAIFRSYYWREQDALLVTGDPQPIFNDLELHLLTLPESPDPLLIQMLHDALAAMSLYAVSRPRFENFAWTVSLTEPKMNLFVSGSRENDTVVGRVFTENVKDRENGLFHAQSLRPNSEVQNSNIEVEGLDVFSWVEKYCRLSDQNEIRFFTEQESSRGILLSPLVKREEPWMEKLEADSIFKLLDDAEAQDPLQFGLKPLTRHKLSFNCGCHLKRILNLVVPLFREAIDDLFQGEESVEVECPRCAAQYSVTLQVFLSHLDEMKG